MTIAFSEMYKGKIEDFRKRKSQLIVSYQVVTNQCTVCPLSFAVSSRI